MKRIPTSVVLGLGFGDEGKGLVTSALSLKYKNPIIIRFGGGQQCGHTVMQNGIKHIFANFGSGSISGAPTYFSKFCTFDPFGIYNEFNILRDKGVNPVLYLDYHSMITTPFDIIKNRNEEKTNQHGSCGVGFGATIQRNENNYHLYAKDLFFPKIFKAKYDLIKKYYNSDIDDKYFWNAIDFIMKSENIHIENPKINTFDHVIFEGHQGMMLDKDYGFFPHVTRSKTNSQNAVWNIDNFGLMPIDVYYTTRCYQIRHGNGPMTNEDKKIYLINNEHETNVENKYQGKFRISALDFDLLQYAISCDSQNWFTNDVTGHIVVTCTDQLKDKFRYTKNNYYFVDEKQNIKKQFEELFPKNIILSGSPYTENLKL